MAKHTNNNGPNHCHHCGEGAAGVRSCKGGLARPHCGGCLWRCGYPLAPTVGAPSGWREAKREAQS